MPHFGTKSTISVKPHRASQRVLQITPVKTKPIPAAQLAIITAKLKARKAAKKV